MARRRLGEQGWRHVELAGRLARRSADPPDPVLLSKVELARAEALLALGRPAAAAVEGASLGRRFMTESRFESAWLSYSVALRAAALAGQPDEVRNLRQRATEAQSALAATLSPGAWATLRLRKDLARLDTPSSRSIP
jgi:hypothetical protein